MIQYTLRCDQGHGFDSWFKSSDAFDKLASAGHVTCAVCGSAEVAKAMMSPRVTTSRRAGSRQTAVQADGSQSPVAAKPAQKPVAMGANTDVQRALIEFRKKVEAQSDYVGEHFAREARAMHLGDAPERSIYGQATAAEAKSLIDDGVPVMPLPFTPSRNTN